MFDQFRPGSIIVTILVLDSDVSSLLISPSVSVQRYGRDHVGQVIFTW
jgi:hypothetical protein